MHAKIKDLVERLESYGFECEAGALEDAQPWRDLKALLDGTTRAWADSLKEVVRLKRLQRPICLEVHLYKETASRRLWVKGWARADRHSPWKPVREEP